MIAKAELRYIRITPRKFRQIIPLVKGKNPELAIAILGGVKKKASLYAIDLLKSAVANSKRIQGIDLSSLFISRMIANCGPTMKRYRAASMGRASQIRKRTSHLIVELDQVKGPAQADKAKKTKAAIAEKDAAAAKRAPKAKEHKAGKLSSTRG